MPSAAEGTPTDLKREKTTLIYFNFQPLSAYKQFIRKPTSYESEIQNATMPFLWVLKLFLNKYTNGTLEITLNWRRNNVECRGALGK